MKRIETVVWEPIPDKPNYVTKKGPRMAGRHKEVIYVGCGVTLKTGLHRFPILCYIAEFLRVFPYFFHHSKDFFFGWNIYHSGSGKINIHLHIAMTA